MSKDVISDYTRIAQAIRLLRKRQHNPPTLAELATEIGLSEFHFQRLFSRWAGVSPKRFLQYLGKERALAALARSHSLLDATLEADLSSPGRLHDLLVTCEAMTPGEIRNGGKELTIQYGCATTPFGYALIGWTHRGICYLAFCEDSPTRYLEELKHSWPQANFVENRLEAQELLGQVFADQGDKPLHLLLCGSNFQLKVWQALLRIAPGEQCSYGQLAALAGNPKASRAVGSAMASNRIAFLIPCHRVIRENGDLSHYRWGAERKALLQGWEAARKDSSG